MQRIKIGVIGFGARMRQTLQPLTSACPEFVISTIVDPDDAARNAAKELWPNVRFLSDFQALVDDPEIQWVCIGSWNSQHREHADAAIQAGKHVFCSHVK